MNNELAQQVLQELARKGVKELCVCPGSRNSPLVYALESTKYFKTYYWPEERSAAFFALGRIKATHHPVAVITTSGTAAAELLPAAMEAYYVSLPLLLITADRPSRFRGSGAPQSAEQLNLFGCYVHFSLDLEQANQRCDLTNWICQGPAHLNICFEEPKESECKKIQLVLKEGCFVKPYPSINEEKFKQFENFLEKVSYPLIVVSELNEQVREATIQFLLKLQAPIYAEAISGIREDIRLASLRISCVDKIWILSEKYKYPIDGILRIGGIPTARLWRDLEEKEGTIKVCSISEYPFSGLSWNDVIHTSLTHFFEKKIPLKKSYQANEWIKADQAFYQAVVQLFVDEPLAEPSLFHHLSKQIVKKSSVYLGNSLPIREWDLAATYEDKNYRMNANRGVNGIDGQIATFLGFSTSKVENWAILGDLTVLYDMVAPWILSELSDLNINLVVMNNGGGQIFARMYQNPVFQNPHQLNFASLANFWRLHYEKWDCIPSSITSSFNHRLIEIVPNAEATDRFWKKMACL